MMEYKIVFPTKGMHITSRAANLEELVNELIEDGWRPLGGAAAGGGGGGALFQTMIRERDGGLMSKQTDLFPREAPQEEKTQNHN